MKSSSRYIGADKIAEHAATIEKMIMDEENYDAETIKPHINQIEILISPTIEELKTIN